MCQMDLWNQTEVFISLFESTCRGLEGGKMWAKIKVVIRHTVVEQKALWLPPGCVPIFHFALNSVFMVHLQVG